MTAPADQPMPSTAAPTGRRSVWRGLATFVLLSLLFVAAGRLTPLRDMLNLQQLQAYAAHAGWRGAAVLLLAGVLLPLALLPRWPLAFACGLLYGVVWGSLLAHVSSLLGAWLQYRLAFGTLPAAGGSRRLQGRWRRLLEDPGHLFLGLFALRAFPLSSFVATNILAGMLRVPLRTYLLASFLGMIPSSVLYAAWGRMVNKPSPLFQVLVGGVLLFLVAGTWLAQRRLLATRPSEPAP